LWTGVNGGSVHLPSKRVRHFLEAPLARTQIDR
jgi:hypothetical protein